MRDLSFTFLADTKANTKRATLSAGFAAYLYDLPCLPLAPVDSATQQRLDLKTPHVIYETYFQGEPDVKKGDVLVIDDVEFPVKQVVRWPWLNDVRLHVIVEDLRS